MLDVDESQLAADPRSGGEDTRDADDTQLNWLTSAWAEHAPGYRSHVHESCVCLLYTSDAADE